MKKIFFFLPLISIFILLLLIGVTLLKQDNIFQRNNVKSVLINKPFPSEEILSLNNKNLLNLKENLGKPFLLNFFSSWCEPCKFEAEYLEVLSNKIMIIGIAYKDKEADVNGFLNNYGNPYKKIGADTKGETAINWGVYGVPETFIINKDGIIILRHAGPITKNVMINEILPILEEINL
jgi:cytochrome c biogenesis protein CcmG/thiol:disulfide interchange protein DsbE